MSLRLCDRCGQPIDPGQLRFIAKIQVFAAYDPLEITFEDLTRDHTPEIRRILQQCEGLTEAELMRDVYVDFQFDLCCACQRVYIEDPLSPPERNSTGQTGV
jgi:hypothetical protein